MKSGDVVGVNQLSEKARLSQFIEEIAAKNSKRNWRQF